MSLFCIDNTYVKGSVVRVQENLYRGVSQYTGEMVYGQLLRGENNFNIVTKFNRIDDLELEPIIKGTHGKFTELLDRKGKQVFIGDIYKATSVSDLTGKVAYEMGRIIILASDGNDYPITLYEGEVIGNIHQNPELLEQ